MNMMNKKAQVGEVLEDFPAFVIIAFMLILMVLLSVLFYGNVEKDAKEQANYAIARDKIDVLLYSLMQEKTAIPF